MDQNFQIDDLDKKILKKLISDARTPYLEIARDSGVSGAAIHQRIQRLFDAGVVNGSEFILNAQKLRYCTCSFIGIFLEKASLYNEVVEQLTKIPEIVECHYTTGNYAIFVKVFAKNNDHLRVILAEKLQSIKGISSTETFISLQERFKRQLPLD